MRYYTKFAKLSIPLLVLIGSANLNGQDVAGLSRSQKSPGKKSVHIQHTVDRKSVRSLLFFLQSEYKVNFNYDDDAIKNLVLNEDFAFEKKEKLEVVLSRLLSQFDLTFEKLKQKNYVIYHKRNNKPAESEKSSTDTDNDENNEHQYAQNEKKETSEKILTGKVTDENNAPLPGVSVFEKGTTNGTVTDGDGAYSLSIKNENAVLVFSFVGYSSQEIQIGSSTTLNISLLPDVKSLGEVVVVGYGTQKQVEVTGAIGSVSAKDISSLPVTSFDQAIQGRVAGVQVTQNSGEPGGSVSIRIRGVGSINNTNEPLYVVDGVPYSSLTSINPNDIERVDVLKDAASTAIYGSRGSNGVVLVTTKRAKAGKVTVTIDAYAGVQNAAKKLDLLNGPEFAKLANENLANAGLPTNPAWSQPQNVVNTDWQSAVLQTSPIQNYSVSVSGGGEKSRALFSAGYFNQEGIIIGSGYKRYTARLNADYDLTSKLKVGVTINGAVDQKKAVVTQNSFSGVLNNAMRMEPTSPITTNINGYYGFNADGTINPNDSTYFGWNGYSFTSSKANNQQYAIGLNNPVHTNKYYFRTPTNSRQILSSFFLEYEIIKGLKFKSAINLTLGNSLGVYSKGNHPNEINNTGRYQGPSIYDENWGQTFQWNWINTATYTKTIGQHSFSVIAGTDALKSKYQFINANTSGVPDNQPIINASNGSTRVVSGYPSEFALVSYIGRITYDYAGKYLFTGNVRRDGSSNFGPKNRYGVFPSASVGWRISEESFMSSTKLFDELKLRASYGTVGNQNIGAYKYLSTFSNMGGTYGYTLGGNSVPAVYADNIGDPSIKWEKSTQTNIGVDASILNGKFFLTADYYVKTISDMLGNFPIPNYAGVSSNSILRNGFSMQNKGIEITLGFHQKLGEVDFSVNGNFATLNNKITKLTDDSEKSYIAQSISVSDKDNGASTRTQVGERIGNFYGYVTNGIIQTNADAAENVSGLSGVSAGDRKYLDLNGDHKITGDDRKVLGNGLPKYTFGLNLKAAFHGFDLSVLLSGQSGVQIANMTRFYLYNMRHDNSTGITNGSRDLLNSWSGEGTSNNLPRNSYNAPNSNRWFSDFYIENGAFLRVRNIQLGYTLPTALSAKLGMTSARVYISAQNLYTFTKYTGYDPEIGSPANSDGTPNALMAGTDFGRYPVSRMFTGGVNIQF